MQNRTSKISLIVLSGIVLAFAFMFSCVSKQRKGDVAVAKVGDKYLYLSEIRSTFSKSISKEDSIAYAKLYIDNWIKTRLMLKKAELNLSKDQLDVSEEIETYRSSLLIYKYEEQMLREKLDTIVHDVEIRRYYETNIANFLLDEHVVKAIYIKLPVDAPALWNVRRWIMSDRERDVQDLTNYCQQYAVSFGFFDDEWVQWAILEFPQKETATRQLAYSERIEQQDGEFIYITRIKDKRAPGDSAPLVFVKDKINTIIINKRKLKFISELEQNIYNDALSKKQFEIFKNVK